MKKRLLSILMTLCMVIAMLPGTAFAVIDDAAEINGVQYATLQAAVDAVEEGQTIKLLKNVTGRISIPYENTRSFTLNLNGYTMETSTFQHTIEHNGTGALTITDTSPSSSGKILNEKDFQYHVIYIRNTGTVNLVNGIVEKNTSSDNGSAVRISSAGHLNISGGKVISTVIAVASDSGSGSADITVSGGEITSSGSNSCVYLNDNYKFTLRGGVITHTNDSGYAINRTDSFSTFKVDLLPGKSATISSANKAMNFAPTNITANPVSIASVNANGTDAASYNEASIASYKYLQFISADVAQIGSTGYSTLQAAFDAVTGNQTIQLIKDISLTDMATITDTNTRSFTLDLNDKTLDGVTKTAIQHEGSGTLTVKDTGTGGKITASTGDGTIRLWNTSGGKLVIDSGTVKSTSLSGKAIEGSYGSIFVKDGTVKSPYIGINLEHTCTLNMTGGTVEGTPAILHAGSGQATITGGTVKSSTGYAIKDAAPGTISIPSGSAIIKGGGMAMNTAPDLTAYTNVQITASNNYDGTGAMTVSSADLPGTYKYLEFEPATVTVPGAPAIGTATAGNGQATIRFTAPDSDGGAEITGYTVTSSPGGITETGASSPITLTGLTNGTPYTFKVTATNSEGIGAASAASNSVTPTAPPAGGSSSSGGGSSITVTKIESGDSVAGANVDKLVKEGKALTVEGKTGEKLVLDTEALKNIDGQTKESVKVEIKDVSNDHKTEHPGRLVVSLTITAGGKHITDFGKGTATISLPYELKEGEKAKDVTVWYLAEDGTMTEVPCTYDATTKLATFKVNHFSLYVVGTADTSAWTNPFSDVKESNWYYDAVRYVSANELMNGTTDTVFNPGAKTTRGMIVTILWRMENEPKAPKEITFADVKNGKYYHDAVAWASEKGIVSGYSAEQFAPEDSITREQLAVILYNYAASKGYNIVVSGTPSGDASGDLPANLSAFSDAGMIHRWGKEALSWANTEGLIKGTGSNLLNPLGDAQRSQVAAILQRFIESTAK